MSGTSLRIAGTIGALLAAASQIAFAMPAAAQSVAERTLSDIVVDNVGRCSTITVNFNIRVQFLSHFPSESGRELHVRVQPLDAGGTGSLRESLRPPESLRALRSIEYEGADPSGPILTLLFTRDMRFEVEPGRDPQSLVIRIAEPGSGPLCAAVDSAQSASAPATAAADLAIPEGLYVVNLASRPEALPALTPEQIAGLQGRVLYETLFERDSQQWHRLRAGFYRSRGEAETARTALLTQFPDAFVVKVSAEERVQGVATMLDIAGPVTVKPAEMANQEQIEETARLIAQAETAIADRDNDRAIALLTNAAALPDNPNTPRALELLGLTRERKGQQAHAQADYEEYLRRYPNGEAADRVRQRLAALTGGATPGAVLREASGSGSSAGGEWSWDTRGSFSQFYFRDQSKTIFVDASRPEIDPQIDTNTNLNQLLTAADVTISGGNDQRQLQLRAAGAYTANFRTGSDDIKSVTALYLDYTDNVFDTTVRLGRQTRNSSGVLGRFDGALISWAAKPSLQFNLVGGFPVLRSRQTRVLTERPFYGASVDIGGRRSPVRGTVYWFDQRSSGGFVDRRSVGLETRVLLPRFNAFTIFDYDVQFSQVNLALVTLNYALPDSSNLSITADYRQSPLLTTNNALIGQVYSDTLQPVPDVAGLRPFFTDAQIYQLAADRTYTAKSVTVSYSRPIVDHLQANLDFTMTDTGGTPGTPASAGTQEVLGLPATGTEFYYGAQLTGTGLFWENDIYILSGRYANTQRSTSYTVDFNSRIPLTSNFRLSPRVRYGLRNSTVMDSTYSQLQPTLRLNYYPMRSLELEIEAGANFASQRDTVAGQATTTDETGFVISAGYRFDF